MASTQICSQFAEQAHSLWALISTKNKFVWEKKQRDAFISLRNCAAAKLRSTHFSPDLPIVIEADASQVALCGLLFQNDDLVTCNCYRTKI